MGTSERNKEKKRKRQLKREKESKRQRNGERESKKKKERKGDKEKERNRENQRESERNREKQREKERKRVKKREREICGERENLTKSIYSSERNVVAQFRKRNTLYNMQRQIKQNIINSSLNFCSINLEYH